MKTHSDGTDKSTLIKDSSLPMMNYDPSDLGSLILIQITPKECTLSNGNSLGEGGGGCPQKKLGECVWPASQNPYPIYNLNLQYSMPYMYL